MLISALCDYYDILSKKGIVPPDGYSKVDIHYLVGLSPDGNIMEIVDYQKRDTIIDKKGKTKEKVNPRKLEMPKRTEKPGIDGNVIEHRPLYIFGLNYDKGSFSTNDKTNKARKSHDEFVSKQLDFLDGLDSPLINAYRNFVQKWNPKIEINNPFLLSLGKMYPKAGYAFCLAGHPELLLHDDPRLRQAWRNEFVGINNREQNANTAQCGITGKIEPIARIHNKITKFPNGASTGNVLVNFKWPAFESYGKKQSYNSNISKTAMKKYTGALNTLVKDPKHRLVLKGLTVLHWAMSESDLYSMIVDASVSHGFDNDSEFMDLDETDAALRDIMKKSKQAAISGKKTDISEYIDPNVSFYMVGLKSNSSRIAVEFIHRDRFGNIFHHITQHQADIQIGSSNKIIPLWRIEKELVNPKSNNEEGDPALLSRIFECIFKGYQYPPGLLATIIRRIKSDSNTEKNSNVKLNQVRAGIIKGYLNRKSRISGRKEEIFMALNRENDNPAYLCGRLFAVLEKLQMEASNNTLNRTIKDAYFSSACSTPKVVFPQLIKLSQHHMQKATYGGYWNYLIGEITGMLETNFPKILSLDEQGEFILGYYQQFWAKNDKKKDSQ